MSTHKHFDKICCVVLAVTLVLSALFVNAEKFGVKKASKVMGYETTIFDNTKVHNIEIIMDDWDEFLDSCTSEEYFDCSIVIDNEAFKNVAIRGKGNTSLSSVASYGNDRYSFKVEFDHYDSTSTYHGLDKLVLNNVIQDNTYMKDYLTYQLMNKMGVAAPLCSYAYITVNGEDWGLYLAVEAVEESFLQRNYGKDYGELYKPDSMNMGGGRGNGKDFDMDDFMGSDKTDKVETTTQVTTTQAETTTIVETTETTTESTTYTTTENTTATTAPESTEPTYPQMPDGVTFPEGMTPPEGGGNPFEGGELPEGFTFPEGMTPPDMGGQMPDMGDFFGGEMPDLGDLFGGEMPEGMTPPDMGGQRPPQGGGERPNISDILGMSTESSSSPQVMQLSSSNSFTPPSGNMPSDFDMPSMGNMGRFDFNIDEETVRNAFKKLGLDESLLNGVDFDNLSITDVMSLMNKLDEDTIQKLMQEIMGSGMSGMPSFGGEMPSGMPGGFGGFGMGSSDVKLQYIDDDSDSYSNIFSSAKTDVSKADEKRLIEALKRLSNGEDLENTVDIEAVINYFVVHNFVVNSDSYTGSMIHNYYLYENDGQMQMIPWDYNLAFGSFMSVGSATSSINDPIDTPLSVSGNGDRPMIDWIFSSDEYTELYHQYFSAFISEYFDSGYFEEFYDSTAAMISPYIEKDPTKFCTYEEFEKGSAVLREFCMLRAESVKGQLNGTIGKTSDTQKSDTLVDGSKLNTSAMGSMGGMGGKGGMDFPGMGGSSDKTPSGTNNKKPSGSDSTSNFPQRPSDQSRPTTDNSNNTGSEESSTNSSDRGQMQFPGGMSSDRMPSRGQASISPSSLIMVFISIITLGFGLVFVSKYKRRR